MRRRIYVVSLFIITCWSVQAESIVDVYKDHGLAEARDQAAHYLAGYSMMVQKMLSGKDICTSKQEVMDFAIEREFHQRTEAKKMKGSWCGKGCTRDLRYWELGIDRIMHRAGFKASECEINQWQPPEPYAEIFFDFLNLNY